MLFTSLPRTGMLSLLVSFTVLCLSWAEAQSEEYADFSVLDRSTSVEMSRMGKQAGAYTKLKLIPHAHGTDLRRSATFLDLRDSSTLSTEPVTLRFALGFEEGFPAREDYLHIFDGPQFMYSIGPDQTWGMSVAPSGKLVIWDGDGKGKVSSVNTGIQVQPSIIYHFTVEVIPGRQEWGVTIEYDDQSVQFYGLGFRAGVDRLGGVVHFNTLLQPDNTERVFYLSPLSVAPGVTESMLNPPAENFIRNADLNFGDRLEDNFFWHRMRNVEYVLWENESGVELVAEESLYGEQAVRISAGATLKVPVEVWRALPGATWTFSVYLKADRDDVECTLQVESYRHLDIETRSKTVTVSRQWQRFELPVTHLHHRVRRSGRMQGPMMFSIQAPSEGASIWVDGLQWESGDTPKSFTLSHRDRAVSIGDLSLPASLPHWADEKAGGIDPAIDRSNKGEIAIYAYNDTDVDLSRSPVELTIPFQPGEWFGTGSYAVHSGERVLDAQMRVLSRWPKDGSVQVIEVSFLADLVPGENRLNFQYNGAETRAREPNSVEAFFADHALRVIVDETTGSGWSEVIDADSERALFNDAEIIAVGVDGTRYSSRFSPEVQFEVERVGAVRTSFVKRGFLATESQDEALLMFVLRLDFWKNRTGADIEVTLINRRTTDTVALREVYWETSVDGLAADSVVSVPWGENVALEQGDVAFLQSYRYQPGVWSQAVIQEGTVTQRKDALRGAVWLGFEAGGKNFHFQVERAWQQHPSMVALTAEGELKGYLWPARPVIGLEFSPGMSITRNFRLLELADNVDSKVASQWVDTELSGRADPARWGSSGLFHGVPNADVARFPVLESRFTSPDNLDRLSPERVESDHLYGLFDYGDHPGDGGWANLESYHDYSVIVRGFRSEAPSILEQGLASARHYRDVDINQNRGMPIVHSANHVIGGSGFGHAWSQGVLAHYLLTGSERSREVLQLHGEAILELPVDNYEIVEGRNLGYFLLTLADFYELTGDQRYVERFKQQIEHAESILQRDPTDRDLLMQRTNLTRDGSFFFWQSSGIVPFALWYGLTGLQKMYELTGDPDLLPHIEREFAISMDFDLTYRYHLKELWPGLPVEETFPLMALEYANGRGSYLFPVLMQYARIFDRPEWIEFGALGVYALALNGGDRIENVLGAAILPGLPASVSEEDLIAGARKLMWDSAADELLNGDFSDYSQYDVMLTEIAGYNKTPSFAQPWLTPHHWRLQMGKELTATGSMRFRQDMADLDFDVFAKSKPSMRLNLSRQYAYTNRISMDTARFKLEPGMYELSVALKQDQGVGNVQFGLVVSDFSGTREVFRVFPNESGNVSTNEVEALAAFSVALRRLPTKSDWQEVTIRFSVDRPLVANFYCNASIARGHESGHLWLDDITVQRREISSD